MIRNLLALPNGEEIFSGTVGENAISSVKVTRCVNSEEELTPGAVCAALLEATVIAEKPVAISAGDVLSLYEVSDSGTRTKLGVFIAEKPVWESANRYTLTAYDPICKLDRDLTQWLENLSGWPYTLLDFASMVCSECGLELLNDSLPNGDYPVQPFSGAGITGRQIMQWAGQASGRFCRATPEGQIEFAWYKKTGKTIAGSEKTISAGPSASVKLEGMSAGAPLQVKTQIAISANGKKSVTLYQSGRNMLDLQSAGVYHSIDYTSIRHSMGLTQTGFQVDIINGINIADRSLWGFCIGTSRELLGKTITVSADYTASKTGNGIVPYLGFFGVDKEPVYTPRDSFSAKNGGFLETGSYQELNYATGQGVRSISYTVTGKETKKYVAILFALCTPGRGTMTKGDWIRWDNIQTEYSSVPSAYTPYCTKAFKRTFPTIYGGSLDWNTGVLTVTHGKIQSYNGEEIPDGWISSTGSLSIGAQVVHPLASPQTILLEPQEIPALEDYNYFWSDWGTNQAKFSQGYYFLDSLRYEDYQVAPIEKVQIRLTEEDIGAVWPDGEGEGNAYILSGNYLLTNENGDALAEVAGNLYEQLKGITYTPCTLDVPATENVCPGDVITVKDGSGKDITVYVMSHTRSGQRDILECTGSPRRDSTAAINKQSYKALSGKIMEMRADVEGLRFANADASNNISELELAVEGISTTVSQQQKNSENLLQQMSSIQQTAERFSVAISKIQETGVSKVKTDVGYTFDDEGLKISRSDAEMTNLLDNTGMYVKRTGDTVLQANADGVEAMNITVRNYLSVGENARFEDYNNGSGLHRTACFFTGG